MPPTASPKVGLLVTCLVDLFRPAVGFAAVTLLERAGCQVTVPSQSCCGQPAWNNGDRTTAEALARTMIQAFEGCDYVVAPSGSCSGMLRKHYPELFRDDPAWAARATALADRTWELTRFLTDIMGMDTAIPGFAGTVTYHDSCSGLREMGVKEQPRRLLASLPGVDLTEMQGADVCCGFGGTFCVKYPDISTHMVTEKVEAIVATGADTLLAGDLGCLMNMAGRLSRLGHDIDVRHVAEVLAGDPDTAPIGRAEG